MNELNRRGFFKAVGAVSLAGAALAAESQQPAKPEAAQAAEEKKPAVQQRKLGKTGLMVPVLAPGVMYNAVDNQSVLMASVLKGATYWDTASGYAGGNSELGIGKFLEKRPVRDKLVIATKASGARDNAGRDNCLQTSFSRMGTDYVDIYYGIHGMDNPDQLSNELKEWAQKAKEEKKIKFFGITTHSNMQECLHACAESGYIDVIMTSYNFRLMQDEKMQKAVEEANKAGIGLVAMKAMAGRANIETDSDKEIAGAFLEKGLTPAQAKICAVLSDKRFASACVGMNNVREFNENLQIALVEKELSFDDHSRLAEIAKKSCTGYCAGCANKCGKASGNKHIADAMRCLMYHDSYGEREMARQVFAEIPAQYRADFLTGNFASAESVCPNNLPIANLLKRACNKLA